MPDMRMEMSKNNKYYIEKHRKYELIHFCKQYPIWKAALFDVQGWATAPQSNERVNNGGYISDPTARAAAIKKFYNDRIGMIEKAAYEADKDLCSYIIMGVTEDMTYDHLWLVHHIPCSRDMYYDRRAKFLYILDKLRG